MDQWRGHVWISLSWHRPWLSVYTVPLSAPATGSPLHGAWRPRRVYCFLLIDAYILGLWQWDGNGIWQRAIDVSAVILRQHSADSTHPTVAKRRRPAVHTATTAVSNSVNIRQSTWPSTRLKGRHTTCRCSARRAGFHPWTTIRCRITLCMESPATSGFMHRAVRRQTSCIPKCCPAECWCSSL